MQRVKRFKVSTTTTTTTTTTRDVLVEYETPPNATACSAAVFVSDSSSSNAKQLPSSDPAANTPSSLIPKELPSQVVSLLQLPAVEENPLQRGLKHAQNYYQHLVKDSSQAKYDLAYGKWQNFCEKSGIPALPADPVHVSACLSLHMFETESLSSVGMLRAAIANKHRMAGLPSPTEDPRVSNLFQAFNRMYGCPRNPVDPITYPMIKLLMNHLKSQGFEGRKASLVTWRTVWSIVINFFTLGRFSDLENVTRNSIIFCNIPLPHMKISFVGVKNDIYSEGGEKLVASNLADPQYCPVLLTQQYLRFLGASYFGKMVPTCSPKNPNLPLPGTNATYTNCLKDLRELFSTLGIKGRFGEHSAKRGGASHAANLGMSLGDLQRLGGWKSPAVPSKYVDLSVSKRIEISTVLQNNA